MVGMVFSGLTMWIGLLENPSKMSKETMTIIEK